MLILPNGTIMYRNIGSGRETIDIDENGNPIPATKWSNSCPCNIQTISESRDGRYEDSAYKKASYTIFVDMDTVGESFSPVYINLTHDIKGNMGKYEVLRVEPYTLTRSFQIWV